MITGKDGKAFERSVASIIPRSEPMPIGAAKKLDVTNIIIKRDAKIFEKSLLITTVGYWCNVKMTNILGLSKF